MRKNKKQKTICIDFDGVIADYAGFQGKGIFGDPIRDTKKFVDMLRDEGFRIIIYTTRSETDLISDYLELHEIYFDYINYNPDNIKLGCNPVKPLADIYIDDRTVRFDGDWRKTFNDVLNFKEWWK